jgi:hypothetical protein
MPTWRLSHLRDGVYELHVEGQRRDDAQPAPATLRRPQDVLESPRAVKPVQFQAGRALFDSHGTSLME